MTKTQCPICRKPVDPVLKPFCSKRCADIDLNRWFTGAYAIPVVEVEDDLPTQSGEEPGEKE
jgi:endogenous inhibitor of DNA gyrase (YacG/DUF329 family)